MNTWQAWLTERNLHDLLTLPQKVLEREWAPSNEDRAAAWDLYTELRTRITTQPLHYRSGDEESALDSLFKLFGLTRDLLHKYQRKSSHFAVLSVFMLNGILRPFTARWHKLKLAGRLSNEDTRRDFRQRFLDLQVKLTRFQTLLGHLAEDADFKVGSESGLIVGGAPQFNLGGDIAADAALATLHPAIWVSEKAEIIKRRETVLQHQNADSSNLIGLAISGGGIRSATFALGVVQYLAERGFLAEVDYLSTVSGGGYVGSFLSSYLNSDNAKVGPKSSQLPFVKPDTESEAKPVRHLRNHSKYLIEGTWFNHLHSVGQAAYGVLTNLLILLPFIVLLASLTVALSRFNQELHWLSIGAMSGMAVIVIGLGLVQNLARNGPCWKAFRDDYEFGVVFCSIMTAAGITFAFVPNVIHAYGELKSGIPMFLEMALSFATPTAIGGLVVAAKKYPGWSRWLMRLFWVSGPLALVVLYLSVTELLIRRGQENLNLYWWQAGIPLWENVVVPWWVIVAATLGVMAYCFLCLNVNMTSPHSFYRRQLAGAYLLKHGANDQPEGNSELKLSELSANSKAPYHLVNGALNLSSSTNVELRGRDSDFFLFSKHYCGSPILGYHLTKEWEALDGHLNLGTAMAISGAAAAPIMGMVSVFGASFMLTVLNVRLSYWLRNPGTKSNFAFMPTALTGPGPGYLLAEMLGRSNENSAYVNVSDGGHLENLAIYELLRRRCKFIIALDGECDPLMTFGSLIQVIRFAQIDFRIRIDIDLSDLRLDQTGFSRAHYALGVIEYPNGDRGYLLYIKSSLTGNEPEYVLSYRAGHPLFPHESTADQLYSEERFEAYRALGHHAASDLFRPELVGPTHANAKVKDWFQSLADSLLAGG